MTISLSIATAIIAVYYETRIVVMAAGTTSLVVLVVTCLTFWSKFDITKVQSVVEHRLVKTRVVQAGK